MTSSVLCPPPVPTPVSLSPYLWVSLSGTERLNLHRQTKRSGETETVTVGSITDDQTSRKKGVNDGRGKDVLSHPFPVSFGNEERVFCRTKRYEDRGLTTVYRGQGERGLRASSAVPVPNVEVVK